MLEYYSVILALILVLLGCIHYLDSYVRWRQFANAVNKLPGPKYIPFLGTVKELWGSREGFVERQLKLHDKYAPLYRMWFGSIPVINILTAEHAEVLLKDNQNITKGEGVEFNRAWLGNNILFSTGGLWHSRRKLLTPAFHFKILDDFSKVFVEKAEILARKLEERSKSGEYIDVFLSVKLCGLDIICKTAMGIELNAMEDSNKKYVRSVELITELSAKRVLKPWLHYNFIFKRSEVGKKYFETVKYLHDFTNGVLQEKKALFKNKPVDIKDDNDDVGTKKRLAFLELLLQTADDGNVLSDEDIKNEVDTFMFAGHDTTTVATSWCLFLIGNHPECQEKVHEELDAIFQGDDRPIESSDVTQMKYLEMCIKESLRLYPSAPVIARRITHPITIGGYDIPIGTTVRVNIHYIHRDPNHFPEPNKFNPDNFLPENCSKRHPFAFIPFSAGLRNCIGQKFAYLEEKILLATILRKFKITSKIKPEEMKVFQEVIQRPQDGIKIKLELRESK